MEMDLAAEFMYQTRLGGSHHLAYPWSVERQRSEHSQIFSRVFIFFLRTPCSVVGGGSNALTLHYLNNDQKLKDGDLVLMDAGGEYMSALSPLFPWNRLWGVFLLFHSFVFHCVVQGLRE